MKKFIKVSIIVFILLVFIYLSFNFFVFGNTYYENDLEAINANLGVSVNVDSVIYKYENKKQEFFIIEDTTGEWWLGHLNKRKNSLYQFREMTMFGPNYHASDWYHEGSFKYTIVKEQDDFSKFDCGNKEPICTEINYFGKNNHQLKGYIYLIE